MFSASNGSQDLVIHRVEEFGDIALHQPTRTSPGGLNFSESCVASPIRTEPMRRLTPLNLNSLSPFAMFSALLRSDYYGDSVLIDLSVLRPSPVP
jgi:hypothetical protein